MENNEKVIKEDIKAKLRAAWKSTELYSFDLDSINWAGVGISDDVEFSEGLKKIANFKDKTIKLLSYSYEYMVDGLNREEYILIIKYCYFLMSTNQETKENQLIKFDFFNYLLNCCYIDDAFNSSYFVFKLYFYITRINMILNYTCYINAYLEQPEIDKMIETEGLVIKEISMIYLIDHLAEKHMINFPNYSEHYQNFNCLITICSIFPQLQKDLETISKNNQINQFIDSLYKLTDQDSEERCKFKEITKFNIEEDKIKHYVSLLCEVLTIDVFIESFVNYPFKQCTILKSNNQINKTSQKRIKNKKKLDRRDRSYSHSHGNSVYSKSSEEMIHSDSNEFNEDDDSLLS